MKRFAIRNAEIATSSAKAESLDLDFFGFFRWIWLFSARVWETVSFGRREASITRPWKMGPFPGRNRGLGVWGEVGIVVLSMG